MRQPGCVCMTRACTLPAENCAPKILAVSLQPEFSARSCTNPGKPASSTKPQAGPSSSAWAYAIGPCKILLKDCCRSLLWSCWAQLHPVFLRTATDVLAMMPQQASELPAGLMAAHSYGCHLAAKKVLICDVLPCVLLFERH